MKEIFLLNGYPTNVIERIITATLRQQPKKFGPKKCAVYLRLPWKGRRPAEVVEAAVSKAVTSTYPMCEVKVVYGTHAAFRASVKDVLPTHQKSNVIYLFRCRCGSRYVGKTTQRLENRIKQHLPSSSTLTNANKKSTKNSSAIYEHLCKNPDCFDKYDKSLFSVVCKACTESVLHVLEALYIRSLKPDL